MSYSKVVINERTQSAKSELSRDEREEIEFERVRKYFRAEEFEAKELLEEEQSEVVEARMVSLAPMEMMVRCWDVEGDGTPKLFLLGVRT